MTTGKDILDAQLAYNQSEAFELGAELILIDGSGPYGCSMSERVSGVRLEDVGFWGSADVSFLVRLAILPAAPAAQSVVTVTADGKKYRVQTVAESADGLTVSLMCSELTR